MKSIDTMMHEYNRGNLLEAERIALSLQGRDDKNEYVKKVLDRMHELRSWNKDGKPSYASDIPRWNEKYTLAMKRIVKFPSGSSILDIGCYWGFFLKKMHEVGYHCHGCDIQRDLMGKINKYVPGIKFQYCNAELVNKLYKKEYFDIVTMFDVLEHIFDDKKAVNAVFEILKPGGIFIINVPTSDYCDTSREHLRIYDIESLIKLIPGILIYECMDEYGRKTLFGVCRK